MDFGIFDADEHYYEAEDCFTRFAGKRMQAERTVRWLTEADGKRRRLMIAGQEANVIGNPTFNPVARPGVYHETLKTLEVSKDRSAEAYGALEPLPATYRDRNLRLAAMDAQGVDKTLLFPTLGVTIEGYLSHDVELLYEAFHAFNQWVDEDWGFAWRERIFAAPYLIMMDVDRLVAELEWALSRGARVITLRPGPAYGRSPADPCFDPFWARVNEAGVLVAYHAYEGPSLQTEAHDRLWAAPPAPRRPEDRLLRNALCGVDTAIMDTLTALVLHGLFSRFPKLRVATIELGSGWVPYLMRRLDHAGGLINRRITAFGHTLPVRPSEVFREKVWVSPFPEEDIAELARAIGVEHVLMGSDWPHAEGTRQPLDYARGLEGFDAPSRRRIMRDNTLGLVAAG
jgi:predicted TIM-barrel fold metal-dependent hydrolase